MDAHGAFLEGWDHYTGYIAEPTFVGDVDGDGADDMAMRTNTGLNQIDVHLISGADLEGASGDPMPHIYATMVNPLHSETAGKLMLPAGDVDADGMADLWVGDYPVYLIPGGLAGDVDMQLASIAQIDWWTNTPPATAAAGDANGDGIGDLIVSEATDLHLFHGPFFGPYSTADAALHVFATEGGPHMRVTADIADLDGDGVAEMLFGTDCETSYDDGVVNGVPYLYVGAADGDTTGDYDIGYRGGRDAFDFWIDCSTADQWEHGAEVIGDVNGDGHLDLGTRDLTAFYLMPGPFAGEVLPKQDAVLTWRALEVSDIVAERPHEVGDLDGDGTSEVVALAKGKTFDDDPETSEGELHVIRGGRSGVLGPEDSDAVWLMRPDEEWMSAQVRTGGDADADGYGDVLVGASQYYGLDRDTIHYHGHVYWLSGATLLDGP